MMKRLETTSLPCMNDEILQATPIIPGRHFPNLHQQMGKGGVLQWLHTRVHNIITAK